MVLEIIVVHSILQAKGNHIRHVSIITYFITHYNRKTAHYIRRMFIDIKEEQIIETK